jgi:hypothetical protein
VDSIIVAHILSDEFVREVIQAGLDEVEQEEEEAAAAAEVAVAEVANRD